MKSFYIITNRSKDSDLLVTDQIISFLKKKGCICRLCEQTEEAGGKWHYTDPSMIPEDTECVLVLGGDGTLLQAARDLVHRDIPLLGINLGTLGFLAEVDQSAIHPSLEKVICGEYMVEERMMLSGTVWHGRERVGQDTALNDITIAREGHLRVVRFQNFVNSVIRKPFSILDKFPPNQIVGMVIEIFGQQTKGIQ